MINRSWSPDYLVRAYFAQGEEWITAAGEKLRIAEMDFEHALNSILMLERVRYDIEEYLPMLQVHETALYGALKARVLAREWTEGDEEYVRFLGRTIDEQGEVIAQYQAKQHQVSFTPAQLEAAAWAITRERAARPALSSKALAAAAFKAAANP